MNLALAIEQANDAKGPDLTDRLTAALDRLRLAPIGVFTVAEFDLVSRHLKWRAKDAGPFRLYWSFEGMPGGRDPAAELQTVVRLEEIATKAGV